MVKVRIPTPLRPLTGGKGEVETQAVDIQSMIDSLNGQFPGLKGRICDDAGEIRRFVNIYLNEEDIRFLSGKETLIKDGDQISIVPAIAGGAPRENAPVLAGVGVGGWNEDQTRSGEIIPAASNNHQAQGQRNLSRQIPGWAGETASKPRGKGSLSRQTPGRVRVQCLAGGCNGGAC